MIHDSKTPILLSLYKSIIERRNLKHILLLAFSFLFVPFVQAENLTIQRKILPYLEAGGDVDNFLHIPKIFWFSHEKIIFGTYVQAKSLNSDLDVSAGKSILDFEQISQVQFFDIKNKKTELYHNGMFLGYEDGIVRVLLKKITVKSFPAQSYDEIFKGPIGEEVVVEEYKPKELKLQKSCPNDNEISAPKPTSFRLLKPEHGCIRAPFPTNYDKVSHVYFRADGGKIELPIPVGDLIGFAIWIDWLNAYLLGDNVTISIGRVAGKPRNSATIKLLYPSGELKLIDMGEYSLTHARPTRAGMIAAKNHADSGTFIAQTNGLYLWRDGQQFQVSEGNVSYAEVSPDGCKVAFNAELKNAFSRKNQISKLRVIDVCEGFDSKQYY